MTVNAEPASTPPEIATLTLADLSHALREGCRDFVHAPAFGLFFSGFYVAFGIALTFAGAGTLVWTVVLSAAFPLFAPFAAVGLYEVSRRLERKQALVWPEVLSVVWAERNRQLPWMGALLLIIVLFWSFFAHMAFALFIGAMPLTNITTSAESLMNPTGYAMIAFQIAAGAATALLTFALTVVSLPYLLDREVDFMTAMITSLRTFGRNRPVLLAWAALIGVSVIAALAPLFLGLFFVLPVFGHATWHLYRRTLLFPDRR